MKLRHLLLLVGLVGIGIIVLVNLGDAPAFFAALQHFHWYAVPLMIAVQLGSYYTNARYYQAFFAMSDHEVDFRRLYEASLAINFVNQAVPSAGVAATTYLREAIKPQVSIGTAALAQLGRYIFTFVSYFIVLAVGFLFLFLGTGERLDRVSVRVVLVLMLALLAAGTVLLAVFSERLRLEATLSPVIRVINGFSRKVLRRKRLPLGPARMKRFLDEIYRGYELIKERRDRWPVFLGWSLACNIAEVSTLYIVFVGLGSWINPGVVITAYTIAIIASSVGFITGGIGIYELTMIGGFVALGVPLALSLSAVLLYRILSMILFLPPGFYFYRRHLLVEPAEGAE